MSGEGRAVFLGERLAGAQHFDIDEVSEQSSPYPHMIPSPHRFQTLVAKVRGHSLMEHCPHVALCNVEINSTEYLRCLLLCEPWLLS